MTGACWTGHPLLDVGVAALCAMREQSTPENLTLEDLDAAADELEHAYSLRWMNPYLTCVYPNGAFTNPTIAGDKRAREAQRALRAHRLAPRADLQSVRCALTRQPAVTVVDRRHMPLMSGHGVLNFIPGGVGSLPVAGWVPLALHAFAMGARRCLGRALAVHSDAPELILSFAQESLEYNRQQVRLAEAATNDKYPDAKAPRTLVVHRLRDAFTERQRRRNVGHRFVSLTVYHVTNSGQGADIDVYQMDSRVVGFLYMAGYARYKPTFDALVALAWQRQRGKGKSGTWETPQNPDPEQMRNYLYDDLFRLPEGARRFIRNYLLGRADREAARGKPEDPRVAARIQQIIGHISWPFVELFLTEIVCMEKERVDTIRQIGDRAADTIAEGDRRLFRSLMWSKSYRELRAAIVRACGERVRNGRKPLIEFDEFLTVFEVADEVAYRDWSMARDLLCLRVLERLYESGYFAMVAEDLEEEAEDVEGATDVAMQGGTA